MNQLLTPNKIKQKFSNLKNYQKEFIDEIVSQLTFNNSITLKCKHRIVCDKYGSTKLTNHGDNRKCWFVSTFSV